MLSFLTILSIFLSICGYGSSSQIVLENHNTVTLRGEISDATISQTIKDISLVPGKEVFLYINSGGGSVIAGGKLVDFLKSTDKKVTCIAEVAASMAMIVFQACEVRIVQDGSILMQHQASYGLPPQPQRNQQQLVQFLDTMTGHYDDMQAARMGLSSEKFRELIAHDLWILGANAVRMKAADKVLQVSCDKDLLRSTEVQIVNILFMQVEVIWSRCPLLSEPINVQLVGDPEAKVSEDALKELQKKLRGMHEIREIARKK